jgi:hypothetical protein
MIIIIYLVGTIVLVHVINAECGIIYEFRSMLIS